MVDIHLQWKPYPFHRVTFRLNSVQLSILLGGFFFQINQHYDAMDRLGGGDHSDGNP